MSDSYSRLVAALANRYRIERELGAGGMATVYLAEDLKHHRQVAVKVLKPDLAATLGAERFVREVEVAARLHHPHILPLYDSGEADGFLFYVMPYEEGQSLRERLQKETELPIRDVVRLLHDVADALTHAHQHGLVHRDIKPENVMLSGQHALVTDFGVAKAVSEATGRHQMTTAGVALGTPVYMAPEQATADPHVDHRADIYALGVLGYELLTGQPPFTGPSPQAVIAAQVTQAPVPVMERRPAVPPGLAALIMRCLEKRPADRYQSAAELLPLLEALTSPSGGTTPLGTAPYQAMARRPRRRLAHAVGVVVVVALMAWLASRAFRPAPAIIEISNIRQVTREAEPEIHVAISPDGGEVAYESGYPGHTHIVVRDVSGGRPLPLTGDWEGAQVLPAWMPDGRSVVFQNLRTTADHAAGSWKLPRLGGQAVALDPADAAALTRGFTLLSRGDTAYARDATGHETLLRIGAGEVHSPAVRGDGRALAYVVGNRRSVYDWGNAAPSEIWVLPAGGVPVLATDSSSLNMSPTWLPDGTLLFVSNRDGARDLYAVRLDGSGRPRGRAVRLTTGLGAYAVSVATDGRTAAYDRFSLRRNIYTIPIPRTGSISLRDARPVTTGNQVVENIDLSADGQWIAYDSDIEGNQDIFVLSAAGGEARQVTRDPGDDMVPDFSPDGREIAFHSARNVIRQIYIINTDGSGERQLTSGNEQHFNPAFSPDGLRLAYASASWSVYTIARGSLSAPWQAPTRLPIDTGYAPRWSPDGASLVYDIRGSGDGIGIYQLGGTARVVISAATSGLQSLRWPEWSHDGAMIYFRALGPDGTEGVYEIAATGGLPRLMVRFDDPSMPVFGGGVLPGNGLFYFAVGEIQSDVYVMDLVRK
ncbi:MAG TPA: protein kinase [Gemmatimonadales bacterium]|nr:protein kinase [Gemmatimonadales bacterium]